MAGGFARARFPEDWWCSVKNISFALTTKQFVNTNPKQYPPAAIDPSHPHKWQTRRLGWADLKPGDRLRACRKCMGLKPGEKIDVLGVIEVIRVERQLLGAMPDEDCAAEGFRSDYILNRGVGGRTLSKAVQVQLIGNSVCRHPARAMVTSNVVEQCEWCMEVAA